MIKMKSKYLVFGQPIIEQEEIDEVINSLESGWIGTGPKVAQFELDFKNYIGSKHAVAVASCTAALHLSVLAMGVTPEDEVIVPTMTFAATANAVIHVGAKPVFVDVDKYKMTIDLKDVVRKVTNKTKAIIPVHFAGRACDIDGLNSISKEFNLKIIHDAAHAVETEYHGKKIGCFGDIANFSFYVTKNITTAEGGMITTDNEEIAQKLKIYALHGMSKDAWKRFSDDGYKHYEVIYPGYKYNMTDLQASLGIQQLKKVEKFAIRRREIWNIYKKELSSLPLILPPEPESNTLHAYHLFTVLIDTDKTKITRDEVIAKLHEMNIGTGVHYIALHLHPFYKNYFGYEEGDFPNAEFISERTLSIPFSARLDDSDVENVIQALKKIFQ
jgi:dTDP-4-amino-4,6-dideoxygalactose transaminase